MKFLLSTFVLLVSNLIIYAQGGIVSYTPFIPKSSNTTLDIFDFPLYIPSSPTVTVVDRDIQVADALFIKGDIYSCDIQVKITSYSNNQVNYEIIGIKGENNWEYIECPLKYISDILSESDMPNELRSFLLDCNEFSRFIAIYNEGFLLTGLKDVPTYQLPRYKSSQKNTHYNTISPSKSNDKLGNDMSISKSYVNIREGETIKLYAYNYGSSIKWESDDLNIATVSPQGVVYGVSEGETYIWARGKKLVPCKVYVNKLK